MRRGILLVNFNEVDVAMGSDFQGYYEMLQSTRLGM